MTRNKALPARSLFSVIQLANKRKKYPSGGIYTILHKKILITNKQHIDSACDKFTTGKAGI
ncbi:hypothetical protein CWM66_06350 [Kosakonia sp. H7A]|uniref:hypothetical protein n=1 Tax=Kosakonia TaxID=1330547 RepID=UPI000A9C9877|nr:MULTISPECIES: hypothetical protein [Kosakonia]PTA93630.1 hypothetical protein CWM66_06350 [Kosakonia sp. H7A]